MDSERLVQLEVLAELKDSCVHCENKKLELLLLPKDCNNQSKAILNALTEQQHTYVKELDGLLLGYARVRRVPGTGWLFGTNPCAHVHITAAFYVFRPRVGATLLCTPHGQKKATHIVFRLHNVLNIRCLKQDFMRHYGSANIDKIADSNSENVPDDTRNSEYSDSGDGRSNECVLNNNLRKSTNLQDGQVLGSERWRVQLRQYLKNTYLDGGMSAIDRWRLQLKQHWNTMTQAVTQRLIVIIDFNIKTDTPTITGVPLLDEGFMDKLLSVEEASSSAVSSDDTYSSNYANTSSNKKVTFSSYLSHDDDLGQSPMLSTTTKKRKKRLLQLFKVKKENGIEVLNTVVSEPKENNIDDILDGLFSGKSVDTSSISVNGNMEKEKKKKKKKRIGESPVKIKEERTDSCEENEKNKKKRISVNSILKSEKNPSPSNKTVSGKRKKCDDTAIQEEEETNPHKKKRKKR